MLSLVRRLIWYRKGSIALRQGAYRAHLTPPGVFVYLRSAPAETCIIALNFTDEPRRVELSSLTADAHLDISTDCHRPPGRTGLAPLVLGPNEGTIARLVGSAS